MTSPIKISNRQSPPFSLLYCPPLFQIVFPSPQNSFFFRLLSPLSILPHLNTYRWVVPFNSMFSLSPPLLILSFCWDNSAQISPWHPFFQQAHPTHYVLLSEARPSYSLVSSCNLASYFFPDRGDHVTIFSQRTNICCANAS